MSDDRIVFFDLSRDKYTFLSRRNTRAALSLLPKDFTSEAISERDVSAARGEETSRVAKALLNAGLLAPGEGTESNFSSFRIGAPEATLLSEAGQPPPSIRLGHLTAFLYASITASWKLRSYSLHRTVRSIQRRRQRHADALPGDRDRDAIRELVAVFHHLRPYYVRKYLCLFDSLALVEFLALYHLYPKWVFGVRTEPFNSHCWVQEGARVLNDSVESVCGYTPIVAI